MRDVRAALVGDNGAALAARVDVGWFEKEMSKDWAVQVEGIFGLPGEPDC